MTMATWMGRMVDPEVPKTDYWGIVGHMAVMFGLPIAVPFLGAFFWLGSLSARVDGTEKQVGHLLEVISGLVTLDAGQTAQLTSNNAEIDRLRTAVDGLIRTNITRTR